MSLRTLPLPRLPRPCSSLGQVCIPRTITRGYASSTNSNPSQGSRISKPLLAAGLTGFTAGLGYALLSDWREATQNSLVKCDGAPAVEAVETQGYPWVPVNALEHDDPRNPMRIRMVTWVKNLQDHIVNTLESIESSSPPNEFSPSTIAPTFLRDTWIRPEGGEGSSCVLAGGRVLEKAGVNVSVVHGMLPPRAQKAMLPEHPSLPEPTETVPFFATGISIVIHPRNPHVPTTHLNYRYFEISDPVTGQPKNWWFGGGADLTPTFLVEEDAIQFHREHKEALIKHEPRYWPDFKKACDKYFYIPHRKETRGVGGIFFDDLTTTSPIHAPLPGSDKLPPTQAELFEFVKSSSSAFLPAYIPIVLKHKDEPWTEEQRRWQLLRRGRYVEFNLVYDRGTKFGLMTPGARIESILMSLPEVARWEYMSEMGATAGTPEAELVEVLKNPRDYV